MYMDSSRYSCILLFIMLFSIWSTIDVHCQNSTFHVTDLGAIANGGIDNKKAFLDAWQKACQTNGGTIVIPEGTYLVSVAEFSGPCNGLTKVIINGTLKASPDSPPDVDYWIMFYNINNLSVYGKGGTFDGSGASFWESNKISTINSIKFESITNAGIQSIKSLNSKMFHIGIHNCQHMTLNNINIVAPSNSPNTDGIHVAHSNDIKIINTNIGTGDDCISIGDGSTNINITGVNCGPGHGLSIGSLGRYEGEKDVSSIKVTNCTITDTQNGLRIKTIAPSPTSAAYDITFQHIIMNNVKNPIIIDQHYCPHSSCDPQAESDVSIKQVKFIDVRGSSNTAVGEKIWCSKKKPCQDIEMSGVSLNYKGQPSTASCSNADVKFPGSPQVPANCS